MKVNFKYSKSEMVAYLMYKGLDYKEVIVQENKRYRSKVKVFFTFEEEKDLLINMENEFNSNTEICLNEYMEQLIRVKRVISTKLKTLN